MAEFVFVMYVMVSWLAGVKVWSQICLSALFFSLDNSRPLENSEDSNNSNTDDVKILQGLPFYLQSIQLFFCLFFFFHQILKTFPKMAFSLVQVEKLQGEVGEKEKILKSLLGKFWFFMFLYVHV